MPLKLNKLRWRCLRGTKELDVLLLRFLEQDYPQLNAAEQQQFAEILAWENQVLLECLQYVSDELVQAYPLLKKIFIPKT